MCNKSKKFNGLEGLRLFAFLNIFWLHIGTFRVTNYYQSAAWGVSFFFTLSGFLYGYKYSDTVLNFRDTGLFILNKLKKFWPLHFFSTILMFGYSGMFVRAFDDPKFKTFLHRLVLNLLLVQSWSHDSYTYYSFTGVAWYLSDLFFLIVITVPLIIIVNKIFKTKRSIIVGIVVDVILALVYFGGIKKTNLNPSYYLYIFPPSRLFEYCGGILTGRLAYVMSSAPNKLKISNTKCKTIPRKISFTLLEVCLLITLIMSFKYIESFPLIWHSTAWIIPNIFLILIFSLEYGLFSSYIFGNKVMVRLGSDTFDAFLMHQVVNIYFSNAMGAVSGMSFKTKLMGQIYILLVVFTFAEIRRASKGTKICEHT